MPDVSSIAAVPAITTTAMPLRRRMRNAFLRWWLRQCLHAQRKNRVVPYY